MTTERTAAANSTYKKLAVQWLHEALCFVSSSVLADSFRLRNRQLLVAATRCAKVFATLRLLHIVRRITSDDAFRLATLDLQHINGFAKLLHLQTSFAVRNFANPPHDGQTNRATTFDPKRKSLP
jgi:hypothetical protein